jgi:hypothetical protein
MFTEWWTNQIGTTEKHLHIQEEKYMLKMLNGFLGNENWDVTGLCIKLTLQNKSVLHVGTLKEIQKGS